MAETDRYRTFKSHPQAEGKHSSIVSRATDYDVLDRPPKHLQILYRILPPRKTQKIVGYNPTFV